MGCRYISKWSVLAPSGTVVAFCSFTIPAFIKLSHYSFQKLFMVYGSLRRRTPTKWIPINIWAHTAITILYLIFGILGYISTLENTSTEELMSSSNYFMHLAEWANGQAFMSIAGYVILHDESCFCLILHRPIFMDILSHFYVFCYFQVFVCALSTLFIATGLFSCSHVVTEAVPTNHHLSASQTDINLLEYRVTKL